VRDSREFFPAGIAERKLPDKKNPGKFSGKKCDGKFPGGKTVRLKFFPENEKDQRWGQMPPVEMNGRQFEEPEGSSRIDPR